MKKLLIRVPLAISCLFVGQLAHRLSLLISFRVDRLAQEVLGFSRASLLLALADTVSYLGFFATLLIMISLAPVILPFPGGDRQ